MTITMTPEVAKILRAPFPAEAVGKLPRIWCSNCRDARGKVCDRHRKVRCNDCRNNITDAHLHLDYVGHAETTDRLLQADAGWTWEPVAFNAEGLPVVDAHGGLWIRLTVAGVTRLGYGHAEGKKGPDAIKEAIGDAIRNAAMRFGVALDLWGATFKEDDADVAPAETEPTPARLAAAPASSAAPAAPAETEDDRRKRAIALRDWALKPERTAEELRTALAKLKAEHPETAKTVIVNATGDDEPLYQQLQRRIHDTAEASPAAPTGVTDEQHRHMHALWRELGYAGDGNRDNRLMVINRILGRADEHLLTTSKDLTLAEADQVIAALKDRRAQVARQREGANA
ncbi:hypothetical protein [Dactylosporangium salmoneum]|uniref:Uncharacterized protein n=1 Tax=Dactylosporangium salmoneum TaxID=53361 RepID=A0ABP5S9N8_9ACTN